jgi:TRAP-type C4-dicarboxylate transport system substrate-binding protein
LARKIAKALGANPVDLTPHDTYLALERGMADGVLCPLAPLRSFKISDSTKHHTIIDLFANPFWAAMNIKKWNSLPPDLQKLLDETTGVNMARIAGQTLDSGAAKDTKWLKANGHTFYSLSPAEKQKWADKVQGLHDEWVNGMEKKGYNTAREIRETTIRLGKEFSK